jgi:hypothetical protein
MTTNNTNSPDINLKIRDDKDYLTIANASIKYKLNSSSLKDLVKNKEIESRRKNNTTAPYEIYEPSLREYLQDNLKDNQTNHDRYIEFLESQLRAKDEQIQNLINNQKIFDPLLNSLSLVTQKLTSYNSNTTDFIMINDKVTNQEVKTLGSKDYEAKQQKRGFWNSLFGF